MHIINSSMIKGKSSKCFLFHKRDQTGSPSY